MPRSATPMPNRDWIWKTIPKVEYDELVRAKVDLALLQTKLSAVLQSLQTEVYTLEQIRRARYQLAQALDLSLSNSPNSPPEQPAMPTNVRQLRPKG